MISWRFSELCKARGFSRGGSTGFRPLRGGQSLLQLTHWAPGTGSAQHARRHRPATVAVLAPLGVTITNQDAMGAQHAARHGERATHQSHEQAIGMRCGSDDLYAPRGEVDHEHGVVRHQSAPRPDFRGEKIRPSHRAPVRETWIPVPSEITGERLTGIPLAL